MGLHSTLFGPVKFAYLPQHLNERELTGGNGMVEMGTFVAILLGQVAGGLLIAIPGQGGMYVAIGCVAVAVLGRAMAQAVPVSPATDPGLQINWNPFTETWRNLKLAHGNVVVFRSLLGISWMWFFGAVFLSMFPAFARDVLHGNEQVASLLLEHGADPSIASNRRTTPLIAACLSGRSHLGVVRRLLRDGRTHVNARTFSGHTALWYACRYGRTEVAKVLLLEGKADPTIADNDGQTPKQAAEEDGYQACVQLLEVSDRSVVVMVVVLDVCFRPAGAWTRRRVLAYAAALL
jgi:hypothetical protein